MNNGKRVNSITYGALMTALLGVVLFFNRQTAGTFDLYLFWIIPLPVIVYVLKFGIRQSFVLATSMVLLSFIIASPVTVFYVVGSITVGLIYGYGMTKRWSSLKLIISVIIVSLVMSTLSLFVFANVFGYNITKEITWYRETFTSMVDRIASGNETLASMVVSLLQDRFILTLIIFSEVVTSIMEGILIHLLSFALLKKLKMETPPIKPISEITAPKWLKVFVFTSFAALFISSITAVSQYNDIIMLAMVIVYAICMLYGYLLVVTIVTLKYPNKATRTLVLSAIVIVMFFFPPLTYICGLVDIYTNTRQNIIREIAKNGISNR